MRRLLATMLALFVIVPAAAQVIMARPGVIAPRVPQVQSSQSPSAPKVDPAMDPDRARAEIDRLKAANRQLRKTYSVTLADLQALRAELDEMKRAGGSRVLAQCVSRTLSRNTAGASEDCAASGYACEPVSGQCNRTCTLSEHCATGFSCNPTNHRCELPPPDEGD